MTMDRFTSDFDRIFADGPTPYKSCFCVGPQRGERECPCTLAQKAVESGTHFRAAAKRPALSSDRSHEEATNGGGNVAE